MLRGSCKPNDLRAGGWQVPLLFLVALLLTLELSGCGLSRKKSRSISVISMTGGQFYWEAFQHAIAPRAAAFDYKVTFGEPQSEADYQLQASMISDAISRHVDGIIVAPSHQLVLAWVLRRAAEAKIAVVVAGAPIALAPGEYSAYIGLDNDEAGRLAADRMIELLHGHGSVGIVGVSPTLEFSDRREKAFANEIAGKSLIRLTVVRYGLADWAHAHQATVDAMQERIDGLFTSDEFATLGALSVLESMPQRPVFVGVGQEPDTIAAVRNGNIDAIIVSNPQVLGDAAIETMHAVLEHERFKKAQVIPFSLVDRGSLNNPAVQATQWNP